MGRAMGGLVSGVVGRGFAAVVVGGNVVVGLAVVVGAAVVVVGAAVVGRVVSTGKSTGPAQDTSRKKAVSAAKSAPKRRKSLIITVHAPIAVEYAHIIHANARRCQENGAACFQPPL